jgi:glycosyltransferase involved in cell wall biosynthesis
MKKRVLVITPFIWEGGPWRGKRTVYAALEGFQRAGYEVHVVTATNRACQMEAQWEGIYIHYFRPSLALGGGEFDAFHSFLTHISQNQSPWRRHLTFRLFWLSFVWGAAGRARQVARVHPPRFLYGINNPGIPPAWWNAKLLRIPFFARIMGSPITQWTDSPLKLYLARFDELLAFKLPARAVIVTDDGTVTAQAIHQELGVPMERIWLFRNGIDKAMFQRPGDKATLRRQLELPQQAPIILWVSQLVNWKHPERLLQALPAVLARVPETRVVILGDGPMRASLERLAQRLGVAHAVRFDGFVPRQRLPLYFHAAELFAAFYDYGNISNSLLEAMLCGLPVVALATGHTASVVREGETGVLIPPDRLDTLPDALLRLLLDEPYRRRLGEQAARFADATLLTWEERIDQEIAQIEAVL